MNSNKIIAAVCGALLLSGCVANDPEYQAENAAQRQRVSASNTEFVTKELGPLVGVCLNVLEKGQPVSSDKMAALGFSKMNTLRGDAYKKKRGDSGWDRLNGSSTVFAKVGNRCSFTIGNFSGYREAFAFVGNSLNSMGYKPVRGSQKGLKYQKGDQVFFVRGSYLGQTSQSVVSITSGS